MYLYLELLKDPVRLAEGKTFKINDLFRIKILARLRLAFSHLREHKVRYDFKDKLNPLCSCSIEAKTTTDYFLHCNFYNTNQRTFINDLKDISISFSTVLLTNINITN